MAGRKQLTGEEIERNKKMIQIGREDGAREAEEARNNLGKSHQLGLISGRAQAFSAMKLIAEFLEWKHISQVIECEEFKLIQGVTSIDDYLESIGFSRSAAYRNLKIVRTLSPTEIQLLAQVGFTRKDLLGYASLPDEKRIEIREGKVINLEKADREEIREIIEQVLQEKNQAEEGAVRAVEAEKKVTAQKQKKIDEHEKTIVVLEERLGLPRDEVAYCDRIEELDGKLDSFLLEIKRMVEGEVPGPTSALKLVALLNRLRMQANIWYQDAYNEHAPADAAPEEEWTQPE